MNIMVYVYHSDLTERIIISGINHGKTWEMPDGEVYDLSGEINLSANQCGIMTYDDFGALTKSQEGDLV